MSFLDILLEMGFSQTKAERALNETENLGVEQAMEWLLSHADEPENDETPMAVQPSVDEMPMAVQPSLNEMPMAVQPSVDEMANENQESEVIGDQEGKIETDPTQDPRSLKCDDCGKLLKSEEDAEFHAAKTGHVNYSETTEEIKPLTDEEKKERVRLLEDRIKQRRLEKESQERREQIEREKQRRRTGQEITEAKKKLEEEELKRIVDQRKKEKLEAKMARQNILEQIERDKLARKEKFGGAQAEMPIASAASTSTLIPIVPASASASGLSTTSQKKEYEHTKIQIRLPSGVVLTQTFGSKEELAAVRLFIQMNQKDLTVPFTIMTNFPKHVFTDEEMEKPLFELGLVPSAVLIVSKKAT